MFRFLQSRDVFDIIFSAEVVFSAVFTLSLFIVVHALLTFMRQSGGLYTRLAQIEAELNVLHASIPGKLERIREMREALTPLRNEFTRIQAYYSRLQHLERQWMEAEAERERAEMEEEEKRIQRRKLGLDRFL